ncbi:MAG: hypothetical protein ORN98_08100, partial [Alphaproteobacteria bacterium]|nr:hypothetical protein [Alphaproteobacteria bacterium]
MMEYKLIRFKPFAAGLAALLIIGLAGCSDILSEQGRWGQKNITKKTEIDPQKPLVISNPGFDPESQTSYGLPSTVGPANLSPNASNPEIAVTPIAPPPEPENT